jgi:hypothetical protein
VITPDGGFVAVFENMMFREISDYHKRGVEGDGKIKFDQRRTDDATLTAVIDRDNASEARDSRRAQLRWSTDDRSRESYCR